MERENSSGSIKIEPNFGIPQEIVEELLSRLPVESLLKSRCVSKSWRSLIDSELFVKFHLKKSTQNPRFPHHRIILNRILSRDRLLMMCSWRSLLKEPSVDPFEFDDVKYIAREINLVGFCNGLVCLLLDRRTFILWNPSTRMSLHLPDVIGCGIFPMYGFGYDEFSDDYKVFTIFTSNFYIKLPPIGRVYSLKSHSWKTMEVKGSLYALPLHKGGKFVSGNLHWFGNIDRDRGIVCFDLKNEAYGMVDQPSYSYDNFLSTQTLGVIEGCLSVLCDYPNYHFDVWVMKEYGVKESWVNLFTITNFHHTPLRTQRVRSFCRGPNGEVLVIYNFTLMIYCYYPEDNVFHCSSIIDIGKVGEVMEEGVYVESLVSLGPHAEGESF